MTEISVGHHGYCGQVQRPALMNSRPPKEYVSLYEEASSIYHHLLDTLCSGADCDDARAYLNKQISESELHTFDVVVHGWGLQGVGDPLIDPTAPGLAMIKRPQDKIILEEGRLLVIQPNIIKGNLGIQVGNLVQVGKKKCRPLQKEINFQVIY